MIGLFELAKTAVFIVLVWSVGSWAWDNAHRKDRP